MWYKDHRQHINRWWYINRRIRPPTKVQPIILTTHTPCNIKKKKKNINKTHVILSNEKGTKI